MKDVTWLAADGSEITQEQWADAQFRCFGMLLGGEPAACLLVLNGSTEDVGWTLPQLCAERGWFVCFDTSQAADVEPTAWRDPVYQVKGRSVALFQTRTV